MSVPEVITACKGEVQQLSVPQNPDRLIDGSADERLQGVYSTGDFVFDAKFLFNASTGKLVQVELFLHSPEQNRRGLEAALSAKYGKPYADASLAGGSVEEKKWTYGKDAVVLRWWVNQGTVNLIYSRLPNTKGL